MSCDWLTEAAFQNRHKRNSGEAIEKLNFKESIFFQVQGTFKLQYLGLKDDTRAIVVVKKTDYQAERRNSAAEVFVSNLK